MSLVFSQDEKRDGLFFSLLFETYEIIDRGVSIAIKNQEPLKGKLACSKGCFNCCKTHKDIPVYPHEIAGIYWYVLQRLQGNLKETLKLQLHEYKRGSQCPFLIDGLCSIHLVRPASCRQFNVFKRACSPQEDPYYTRRQDVLIPERYYIQQAFLKILPFYGLMNTGDPKIAEEFIRSQAKVLQHIDWTALARRIK